MAMPQTSNKILHKGSNAATLHLRTKMKAILQRVLSASVTVEKEPVSSIGRGILVFAAMAPGDTEKDAEALASKILKLRLWDDEETGGRWKHNVRDIGGEVLCVSQFTLLASTKKGNKPDFHGALSGDEARLLYQYFFERVKRGYAAEKVKDGVFQAMMEVALVNDGPVSDRSSKGPPKARRVSSGSGKSTTAQADDKSLGDVGAQCWHTPGS